MSLETTLAKTVTNLHSRKPHVPARNGLHDRHRLVRCAKRNGLRPHLPDRVVVTSSRVRSTTDVHGRTANEYGVAVRLSASRRQLFSTRCATDLAEHCAEAARGCQTVISRTRRRTAPPRWSGVPERVSPGSANVAEVCKQPLHAISARGEKSPAYARLKGATAPAAEAAPSAPSRPRAVGQRTQARAHWGGTGALGGRRLAASTAVPHAGLGVVSLDAMQIRCPGCGEPVRARVEPWLGEFLVSPSGDGSYEIYVFVDGAASDRGRSDRALIHRCSEPDSLVPALQPETPPSRHASASSKGTSGDER